jgi:undecaprenyl-diphosphatase
VAVACRQPTDPEPDIANAPIGGTIVDTTTSEVGMDASLYRMTNRLAARTSWAHWLFIGVARFGIALFAVALVVGWWQARQADSADGVVAVGWAGAAALIALAVAQVIGNAVDRARPYTAMPTAHVLTSRTSDFSFPSDHATVAGAIAVGLLLVGRRIRKPVLGWIVGGLAILMAFSRVYVGVHYPGDVLGGLVLGGAVAAMGFPFVLILFGAVGERLLSTPARVLLTQRRQVHARS